MTIYKSIVFDNLIYSAYPSDKLRQLIDAIAFNNI